LAIVKHNGEIVIIAIIRMLAAIEIKKVG